MEKKDKLKACSDWIVLEESGRYLGEIGTDNLKYSEACELAQTLVHRYNSHAGLVEALEDLLEKSNPVRDRHKRSGSRPYKRVDLEDSRKAALAALAAVKEGK